jgi:hypothetical protein
MKTPEEWDKEFDIVVDELRWEVEDPYSERMTQCCERTYAYEIRDRRLEIIRKIQSDGIK